MRNYQLRKTNNEVTLKKKKFLVNNKWGRGWDCIYMYIRLCFLGFGVTLLIFQNSKKKELSKNQIKRYNNNNKKN